MATHQCGFRVGKNFGKPVKTTNLEISYASKKAVEVLEKLGGKIKLTKK